MSKIRKKYSPKVQVQSQSNQATNESSKYTLMFYQDATGQFFMYPNYQVYFGQMLGILGVLYETVNQKWSQQQITSYLQFLADLDGYIRNYIFTGQVCYQQQYHTWIEEVKNKYNPVGFALYETQLDYVQKKSSGHNFYDDKKQKDLTKPKQEQVAEQEVAKKKQTIESIQGDPKIKLQILIKQQWDPTIYLSTSFLAKQKANIVFIGHAGAGKSTLTGNILKKLKLIDERELLKNHIDALQNKMESWEQGGISNFLQEERQDGKTRQYAKLNFDLQKKRFTLFDAPGSKDYVPNMIMAAYQADIAVLIISAKEGEFESGFKKSGQTKEHALLAKALGINEIIVILTNMEQIHWKQQRFLFIKEKVQSFLENVCDYCNVTFIPVQSIFSCNIHTRIENSWYKGPAFLQYLDNVTLPKRKSLNPLRIPVIDIFKNVGGQLYLYGKIESGTILENYTVTLLPEKIQLTILQIFNAKDERLPFACAGENVKIRIKNIDENSINRGDVICNNQNYCQKSSEFKVIVNILELPQGKKLMSSGYECVIHMHAIQAQVQIQKVIAKINYTTGEKNVATYLKGGEKGICILKIERTVCLQKYDFMPSLGRFILRDQGITIGYGEIIGTKTIKSQLIKQKEQKETGEKKQSNNLKLSKEVKKQSNQPKLSKEVKKQSNKPKLSKEVKKQSNNLELSKDVKKQTKKPKVIYVAK